MIGIPVYYHYCGGELAEINYVLKSNNCCSGEENDSAEQDNGCCKDENLILKSNIDFTIKDLNTYAFVKTFSEVFFLSLPFTHSIGLKEPAFTAVYPEDAPPGRQQHLIISTSVLRI